MSTLVFEFERAEDAQTFFEFCECEAKLTHRVVEAQCGDEREEFFAREGAAELRGRELPRSEP